ncbi:hypothetical protein ES708_27937 [subsurface metagenome]
MLVLENVYQKTLEHPSSMDLLGVGLVSMTEKRYNIVFSKGIKRSLIKLLIRFYRSEILEKKEGKRIKLLGAYTIYVHFYTIEDEHISIFYVSETKKLIKYDGLCSLSKQLLNSYCSNATFSEINQLCNRAIPSAKELSALFVISTTGHSLFTKVRKDKKYLADNFIIISGFISAILTFSNEVIGKNTGDTLQAINFENQQFFLTVKEGVIFAYLIEDFTKSKNIKRFMELLIEEFLDQYCDCLEDFNGEISQFSNFERVVDKYFDI